MFSAWLLPYFILLIAGIVIPSDGGHGFLNVKSLAFLASCLSLGLYACKKQSITLYQVKLLAFFGAAILFLLGWLLLGMMMDKTLLESQIDQLKIFIITLAFVFFSLYWQSEGILTFQHFLKVLVYANFTYSFFKVMLVVLHLLDVVNMYSVLSNLGLRFMSMTILGSLTRMQTSVDIVSPFLLFFVLQSERFDVPFPKYFKRIYFFVSLLAIFLSFSRFMLLVAFFSYLLYIATLNLQKMANALLTFLIAILAFFMIIGPQNTLDIIEKRFFSHETALSDRARKIQIDSLLEEYDQYPLFGKGLGSYTRQSIRDVKILHSYEVQWMAFLMQFGCIGVSLLIVPLAFISSNLLSKPHSILQWASFCLFLLWLFAGFTNPFLISLTSGIIYSLFVLHTKSYQ